FPVYSDADRRVIGREWEAAHDSLHRELLSGCQSPWLIKLTDELRDQATRYRHISAAASNSPSRNVVAEHTAIVEAAISRKVELAVALLCEHISTSTTIAVSEFPSNEKPAKSKLTGLLPRAPKVVGAPTEAHSSTV
ncbi:MAG: FCD domain-containing protein, partial [Comamonadaceae bacterium]